MDKHGQYLGPFIIVHFEIMTGNKKGKGTGSSEEGGGGWGTLCPHTKTPGEGVEKLCQTLRSLKDTLTKLLRLTYA